MKTKKQSYRIENWKGYNQALVERGSLTLWFDQNAIKSWQNKTKTGKRGRSRVYTNTAIVCALTLKAVFRLPLRATEGFLISLVKLMRLEIPVPDYTTMSRRQQFLDARLERYPHKEPLHVVVDSTGLKIFGEGEWKVRQHGWSKRRTWRKLHLGIDAASGEIVATAVTKNGVGDGEMLPDLLSQIDEPIHQVSADGAYDTRACYESIDACRAIAAIPPRRGAKIWQHGNAQAPPLARDENLRSIRSKGRKGWKKEIGYHQRSLAETAMSRIKMLFGHGLNARLFESQISEALIRCNVLNRMTHIGMPQSYLVG